MDLSALRSAAERYASRFDWTNVSAVSIIAVLCALIFALYRSARREVWQNDHEDHAILDDRLSKTFDMYRDYVKHQYDLINHRVTWYLATQSFLLATYGYLLNQKVSSTKEDGKAFRSIDSMCDCNDILCQNLGYLEMTMISVSIVGLCLSIAFFFLLKAASAPVDDIYIMWARRSGKVDYDSTYPNLTGGVRLKNKSRGRTILIFMPLIMMTAWICIFALTEARPLLKDRSFIKYAWK